MFNPLIGLGLIAAVLAGLAGMYQIGHIDGVAKAERQAKAELLDSLTRAIDQAALIAAQDAEILSADVVRQARVVTQFQIIDREVSRYAIAHADAPDCLDAGGLRIWTAAARGDAAALAAAAPGLSDAVSPDPAGAADGDRPGPAYQLRGRGTFLSPAAGPLSNPGGVGGEPQPAWHW